MFTEKTVLITGGTGSWGNALVSHFLTHESVKELRVFSRGEYKQVDMQRKFTDNPKLKFTIGDVRDPNALGEALTGVNIVFHLAALKHVPVCEQNPWQAVLTNVYGTQNVIEQSIARGVQKVIFISTDKAVEPLNLYGMTKACAEKLILRANWSSHKTRFVCIRAGNVIGTNGSVVPLFIEQIRNGNQITLTDATMTRFLIGAKDAIRRIMYVSKRAVGGELFVLNMPSSTNAVLVQAIINLFGNKQTKIKTTGSRQGEKVHEVLISKHEAPYARMLTKELFLILPSQSEIPYLHQTYKRSKPINIVSFSSDSTRMLSQKEVETLLIQEGYFPQR